MTTHLMCDTETLATRPGAMILSVAFVRFADEAQMSINLDMAEQQRLGMAVEQSTLDWWQRQDPAAWQLATQNPLHLRTALEFVNSWIAWAGGGDFLIWCHGATFDAPLLDELYRRVGVPCPWHYWQVRDTRTLYDLAGVDVKAFAVPPPHVALNDAIGQTRAANEALRRLMPRVVAA